MLFSGILPRGTLQRGGLQRGELALLLCTPVSDRHFASRAHAELITMPLNKIFIWLKRIVSGHT